MNLISEALSYGPIALPAVHTNHICLYSVSIHGVEAPLGVWDGRSPPVAESVCRHCRFRLQKQLKFKNFTQFTSWFFASIFTAGRVNDPFGGGVKLPSSCLAPPLGIFKPHRSSLFIDAITRVVIVLEHFRKLPEIFGNISTSLKVITSIIFIRIR